MAIAARAKHTSTTGGYPLPYERALLAKSNIVGIFFLFLSLFFFFFCLLGNTD